MIRFILILLLLGTLAQFYLTRKCLDEIREDIRPEINVAEPGQVFFLRVTLQNTGRRFLPFLKFSLFLPSEIEPQDPKHCTPDYYGRGCTFSCTTWLRPHQQTDFRIPVRINRRGRYLFQPLLVSVGDFLGLKEESRRYDRFREVVVAPKEAPEQEIQTAMTGFLGEYSVRRFLYEDPVLSAGFREYTGQEPMKKISWLQSAKGNGIMVKNDDYTSDPSVVVLLNTEISAEEDPERSERCYSAARSVCRNLEDRRIPYTLQTNTVTAGGWYAEDARCILNGFGAVHFGKVLELLGRATAAVSASGSALTEKAAAEKAGCSFILITTSSGMPDAASLAHLRAASNGCLLILTPEGNQV